MEKVLGMEITEIASQARMGVKGHTDLTDLTDFASQARRAANVPQKGRK